MSELLKEVEGEAELFRNIGQVLGRKGFLARLVRVRDRYMPRHQGRLRKQEGDILVVSICCQRTCVNCPPSLPKIKRVWNVGYKKI